jgi:hypothetical protein
MKRSRKHVLVGSLAALIAFAGIAAIAIAAVGYPTDSVTVMTGCLTTSGTSAGNILSVAVGNNPVKSCGSNQMLVHLSGGTITRITAGNGVTLAGSGGTGGTGFVNNGFATVGLDSHYQLPQSGCAAGQVVASNGSGGWTCQSQTTYSGSDFALSNQSCDSGQFLTGFDASGGKQCADDTDTASPAEGVSDLTDYTHNTYVSLGDNESKVAESFCASGDIAVGGGWSLTDDATIVQAGPVSDNGLEGWSTKAKTGIGDGFEEGSVTTYVKCLTTLH